MIEKYVKRSSPGLRYLVGDSHRYKNEKGEISLVYPCMATMDEYEMFCIQGDLFEDIERFSSFEEAEERINELLNK